MDQVSGTPTSPTSTSPFLEIDRQLIQAALLECLDLLRSLDSRSHSPLVNRISHQCGLRLTYVLLHGQFQHLDRHQIQLVNRYHSHSLARSLDQLPDRMRFQHLGT